MITRNAIRVFFGNYLTIIHGVIPIDTERTLFMINGRLRPGISSGTGFMTKLGAAHPWLGQGGAMVGHPLINGIYFTSTDAAPANCVANVFTL
jgi:hypothetical protein